MLNLAPLRYVVGIMEYWNDGLKEEKQLNMIFSVFGAHYSIIPIFHHSIWMA